MFSALLFIFVAITIWADWRIYTAFIKGKARIWTLLWKIQSIVSVVPFFVMYIGGFFVEYSWTPWIIFSLWYIAFFIIQFALKFFPALSIQLGKRLSMPLAVAVSIIFVGIYIYGIAVCRCEIDVRQLEIKSEQLPVQFNGFKAALVSDLHIGTMYFDGNLLERTVDSLNALNPDIVFICGDLINIDVNELSEEKIGMLSRIKAPVYSVLGNHDQGFYIKDTIQYNPQQMVDSLRFIESNILGWTILENSHVNFRRGNDSIAIAGVTYPNNFGKYSNSVCGISDLHKAVCGISESDFSILLSHSPQMADSLSEKGCGIDLMLSGHTHSMQMRVAGFCPTFFVYSYPWGLYDIDGTTLYVNGGIGTVGHPFRIGALPEITAIILKKQ